MDKNTGSVIDGMLDEEAKLLIEELKHRAVRAITSQLHNFSILAVGQVDTERTSTSDEKYVIVRTAALAEDKRLLVRYTLRGPRGADTGAGDVDISFSADPENYPTGDVGWVKFNDHLIRVNHFDVTTWLTLLRTM